MRVYTLKELEKSLQSVASINGMQVKEYLQALQDENQIRVEKIGSGNWYWCFLSDAKKQKGNIYNSLKAEEQKLKNGVAEVQTAFDLEVQNRAKDDQSAEASGHTRDALLGTHEELTAQLAGLDQGLACFSESDPATLEAKAEETKRLKDSAIRLTDNIYAMESFFTNITNDREKTGLLMANACGDEYVIGEGLKEL